MQDGAHSAEYGIPAGPAVADARRALDLLHIEASPRAERSRSGLVAETFIGAYRASRPDVRIETLNLWKAPLPDFDGPAMEAKYAVLAATPHTPAQAAAWAEIGCLWRRFDEAEALLFSVPMWNRTIPYILKHYIDVITQPGLAFSFTPDVGYRGLARPKPVTVVYASASDYARGAPLHDADFQKPYFEHWLGFVGFTDIRRIVVAPTMGAPDAVETVMRLAIADAERAASLKAA